MLHASQLAIRHPVTQQPITLLAPVPDDMFTTLQAMGFKAPLNGIHEY